VSVVRVRARLAVKASVSGGVRPGAVRIWHAYKYNVYMVLFLYQQR